MSPTAPAGLAPEAMSNPFGFRFDYTPPSGGYAWWYIDGVSEDGANAIVIIIFVGSVFSPYYAWTDWRDPAEHCAINVALYGRPGAWSMTERRARDTRRTRDAFSAGKSCVRRTAAGLQLDFDEIAAPIPFRVRGQVEISLPYLISEGFTLDANDRHFWSPACSHARIKVDFDRPDLSWRGHGYVDSNYGLEPVTDGFDYWDWSRTPLATGETLIRYVTDPIAADQRTLHLRLSPQGDLRTADPTPDAHLGPTPIWRIARRAGSLNGQSPQLIRTLEDTPFYSRSLIDFGSGTSGPTSHETLSCRRLRSPLVRALLPFRMPRLSL